jgi:hypothetical protein
MDPGTSHPAAPDADPQDALASAPHPGTAIAVAAVLAICALATLAFIGLGIAAALGAV